jgi:glycosyltransferase involved in cell wall biosynthesis
MKVLYFHQYFSTPKGTAGIRSYEMARHLTRRGHQVLMVCGSADRGQTGLTTPFVGGSRRGMIAEGFEVLEFDLGYANRDGLLRRSVAFLRFALRSVHTALREPADLVFATTTPLTAALPGIAARWIRRLPFVFEVRDLWPELPRAMGVITNPVMLWALSMLEWSSYHSATSLIGLAPGIVDGIVRRGVDPARVHLVPNGCDLDIFSAPVEPWRPAGVRSDDLMAVFAGAHGMANGLDAVLDAAAVLKGRGRHDIAIVLIGEGKLKPALQRRGCGAPDSHQRAGVLLRHIAQQVLRLHRFLSTGPHQLSGMDRGPRAA